MIRGMSADAFVELLRAERASAILRCDAEDVAGPAMEGPGRRVWRR